MVVKHTLETTTREGGNPVTSAGLNSLKASCKSNKKGKYFPLLQGQTHSGRWDPSFLPIGLVGRCSSLYCAIHECGSRVAADSPQPKRATSGNQQAAHFISSARSRRCGPRFCAHDSIDPEVDRRTGGQVALFSVGLSRPCARAIPCGL